MNLVVRPPPSPTPSDGRPVCRICLGGDEEKYRLIHPCRCRGTIALVHPTCLTTWVNTCRKTVCQTCTTKYEMEPDGELKNIRDWTLPTPLSNQQKDQKSFCSTIIWIIYLFYLGYVYMRTDIYEMSLWMDGHIKFMYALDLALLFYPNVYFHYYLAKLWQLDNSEYKFKDRSTEAERNGVDMIQLHPFHCSFCPTGIEKVSPLIWPCTCRRDSYLIHSDCLVTFSEKMKVERGWYNLNCGLCLCIFEKIAIRMKKMIEWKWPRPLSESYITRTHFCDAMFYNFYLFRTIYLWIMLEGDQMRNSIFDLASFVCWVRFWKDVIYYTPLFVLLAKKWIKENSVHKFKERILTERKARTEMKTARSAR